jgi:leucyl aminopeptidase (aminopeptidase T)/transposase
MRVAPPITLSPEERAWLHRFADRRDRGSRTIRARIVLAAADGLENLKIAESEGISRVTVARWRERFLRRRLPGLDNRARVSIRPTGVSEETVRAIVRATSAPPPAGHRAWTTRSLAREFRVSHMTVRRIWQTYQIRPSRYNTWPLRADPVAPLHPADVVGLYLNHPTGALALTLRPGGGLRPGARLDGGPAVSRGIGSPLSPVAPRGDTAALGRVGPAVTRERVATEFLRFLTGVERKVDEGRPLRVVVTGPWAVDSARVDRWKVRHPKTDFLVCSEWAAWKERAIEEIRDVARPPQTPGSRRIRGELVRALSRSLRDYGEGSAPFEWLAPAAPPESEIAAFRLRYDLAVTGHPGFKSPTAAPLRMAGTPAPNAKARELARNVLRRCLRVQRGERVTIESWTATLPEANAFVLEATRLGARPLLLYQDESTFWATTTEVPPENLGSLGEHRKAAIERTDVLVSFFGPSDRERFHSLPPNVMTRLSNYGDALYAAAARGGARAVQMALGRASPASARMYGVDLAKWRKELVDGCLVDPAELRRRGAPLAERFGSGRELTITHANGTDLRLRLKHRKAMLADGIVVPARRKGNWSLVTLPAGVVTVAVDERYAEGTFHSNVRSSIGLSRGVGEFAGGRWSFAGGHLVRHTYDEGGELFAESYRGGGPGRDLPGSVAVGLNDALAESPLLEDQGYGTITLHIGRNDYLGGANSASWWAWLYLRGADLSIDGEKVLRAGKLRI